MTFVQSLNSFFDFVDQIDKVYMFYSIVVFVTVMFIWENYLAIRQFRVEKTSKELPKELVGVIENETFEKSRVYALDQSVYSLVVGFYNMIETYLVIFLGAIPYVWNLSSAQLKSLGVDWLDSEVYFGIIIIVYSILLNMNFLSKIVRSMLFVFYFMVFSQITSLPWSFYYTFVLEERHGFNKQTVMFFIKDNIKEFIVSNILIHSVLALLIYIIRTGGDYFFIYAWIFTTIISLFWITIYADFIAPLFDKFEPLQDGELKTRIEELAKSLSFPLYKLYVIIGSRRSTHSNAYMYGFYKSKRIVLFDTLIEGYKSLEDKKKEEEEAAKKTEDEAKKAETSEEKKESKGCNNDEILAILAHELGHWKLNHNVKNIIMSEINTLLYFLIFAVLMNCQVFYSAFGFEGNDRPVLIGLIIIIKFIFAPYNELVSFLMTCIGRRFEFQADEFAKGLVKRDFLKSALIKTYNDNLSFPIDDWLYSTWHYSHPPLLERLRALNEDGDADKKKRQ